MSQGSRWTIQNIDFQRIDRHEICVMTISTATPTGIIVAEGDEIVIMPSASNLRIALQIERKDGEKR